MLAGRLFAVGDRPHCFWFPPAVRFRMLGMRVNIYLSRYGRSLRCKKIVREEGRAGLRNAASLWSLSAAQLRDHLSSVEPTPGGGSACIIAATLGAASVHKGIIVSLKRSATDPTRHQALLKLSSEVLVLIATLSELADADSVAFQDYLETSALPNTTENERAARKEARESSLVHATQIPLTAAVEMTRGLELAEAAADLVDAHVRSEVLSGSVLLRASIKSVLIGVDANLPGISDVVLREALRGRREELERSSNLR
jgi:formiminotetrahydrofolate cyclodeaminase